MCKALGSIPSPGKERKSEEERERERERERETERDSYCKKVKKENLNRDIKLLNDDSIS
jgi:hypothetical protein